MTKRLNFKAAFNNRTGYSICSVNIGQELSKKGVQLSLFPIGGISQDEQVGEWVAENHYTNSPPHRNSPCLAQWHEHQLYEYISAPFFGWPIFEIDNFPATTKNSLSYPDDLIVCTEWAKSVLVNLKVKQEENIGVCPLGVNSKVFCPSLSENVGDKYIFINVGKFSMNKGHHLLPTIFNRAFSPNDNVELWLLPNNPFLSVPETSEWIKLYKNTPLGHKVKIFSDVPTQQDLAHIISRADCGIFPALCEGWNLPLLEVMSMGKPVIATNYSGHTGFCDGNNSYLVTPSKTVPAVDNKWFFGDGNWAYLEDKIDDFADLMKSCYQNHVRTNYNGILTGEKFSWENSATTLMNILFKD